MTSILRRAALATTGACALCVLAAVPALAANVGTAEVGAVRAASSAGSLECTAKYGKDSRIHADCSGDGAWTLHITCWPGIQRSASTVTHGYSELSLGCGPVAVTGWEITFP